VSSSHLEMSATNEDTVNRGTDQAAMDAGTASRQDAVVNEEMLQDLSDTVTVAESGSINDRLSVVADVVSEPEVTNVSSETSNSSQGSTHFRLCLSVKYFYMFCFVLQILFLVLCLSMCLCVCAFTFI